MQTVPPALAQCDEVLTGIIAQRHDRYGLFKDQAVISQDLKSIICNHLGTRKKVLAADQQEALDMICNKISRIINGDPDYDDSWLDIAGYAMRVAERLEVRNHP